MPLDIRRSEPSRPALQVDASLWEHQNKHNQEQSKSKKKKEKMLLDHRFKINITKFRNLEKFEVCFYKIGGR